MDWNTLIEEQAIQALLSKGSARFARPVREALALFLGGLPDAAQRRILAEQAALPSGTGASARLVTLARQCPVLHKLGQSLARDRRLEARLRRELSRLEALPCSVPVVALRETLQRELGPLQRLGVELDSTAIAEASVAVVIGYRDAERSGVFKILKPDIEERLQVELGLLERVGLHLEARCSELGLPQLDYPEVFRQVSEKLRDEIRLTVEQRNLGLAAVQYAGDERILVPTLHEHCTANVTAMERVSGRKVTDHGLRAEGERLGLSALVATALLARPLFSSRDDILFHGDPHAGNLLLTPEGRLAILDWSLAGRLRPGDREAMVQILFGAMMLDERRVVRMLESLCEGRVPDPARLRSVVRDHLRPIGAGGLPDFGWVIGLLDEAFARAGLRASNDLLLFRKSLHILHGVLADLGPGSLAIDQALVLDFIRHLADEWPLRWLAAMDSRALATRLSNADLTQMMLTLPITATRCWLGWTRSRAAGGSPDSPQSTV
jgi:ubiquinone biosynthesis protein